MAGRGHSRTDRARRCLTMGRHRAGLRGIRIHRSYDIAEAARAMGVSRGTVRRWIKAGLPVLRDQRPYLILGSDIVDFHTSRSGPKQKCAPHECYCVKCRAPRSPAAGMAEYIPLSASSGNLRGICPECGTLMHRRVAVAALAALRRKLDLSIAQGTEPIGDMPIPCPIDHIDNRANDHAKAPPSQ
ncbi:helix-turn-helix domain-containing protein [Microbaculum marinisediminis]|uniref:helix-turn-helix domain-containing protein n=1 Tax=Microbaculum marinisediminis TaxID=2931392 RepID=UPI003CC68D69